MNPEEVCAISGVTLEYHRGSNLLSMRVDGFEGEIVFSLAAWHSILRAWSRFDEALLEKRDVSMEGQRRHGKGVDNGFDQTGNGGDGRGA